MQWSVRSFNDTKKKKLTRIPPLTVSERGIAQLRDLRSIVQDSAATIGCLDQLQLARPPLLIKKWYLLQCWHLFVGHWGGLSDHEDSNKDYFQCHWQLCQKPHAHACRQALQRWYELKNGQTPLDDQRHRWRHGRAHVVGDGGAYTSRSSWACASWHVQAHTSWDGQAWKRLLINVLNPKFLAHLSLQRSSTDMNDSVMLLDYFVAPLNSPILTLTPVLAIASES